ncbi:MAG: P1 family peptidase [Myxococcota bacterium]
MNRSLTAVAGVQAGHATDAAGGTGVTAVLFRGGARAGHFVPGSATGSRELGVLEPGHVAARIHALCLAGGSAFGLAAADGVMAVLAAEGVGFPTAGGPVPIVPAAILFDLDTATRRPDKALGEQAARAASADPLPEGRVGAGTGARVGRASGAPAPGGFGGWAEPVAGHVVAAGVAVNAVGSVIDPATGALVAGGAPPTGPVAAPLRGQTTLAVVATDAPVDRDGCTVVARMASAGLARTLYPAFTPFDGDLVLVASTGDGPGAPPELLAALGDAAARCVAAAILRAVDPARR